MNFNRLYRIFTLFAFFMLVGEVAVAQPAPVKKAAKSMFKLTTFDASGNVLNAGYGVFVAEDGTCLGSWEPFVGASSAVVIDAQGRKYDVDCLIGANEIYDVAKFRVIVPEGKKMAITPVPVATAQLAEGGQCWLVEYAVKTPVIKKYVPSKIETFATSLPYYIFEQTAAEELAGCPFLNDLGEVMGLMQPAKRRTDVYCPSAQYAMTLSVNGLTANEPTLKQTAMRVSLPDDYQSAVLAMMMASSRFSSPSYLATANEFIQRFPTASDGYSAKADYLTAKQDFSGADAAMKECVEKTESKAEAYYTYSKLVFTKLVNLGDSVYEEWSYDRALELVNSAYAADAQPIYAMHKAKILYAMKKYQEAYEAFYSLRETNMRDGELFYYASLCQQNLNADNGVITALLDSALACYEKPYKGDALKFLLLHAEWLDRIGESRAAVSDLNEYEASFRKGSLSAAFYYNREQMELRAKLYQLALNDINLAINLAPDEHTFYAEKALLLVRVKHIDEAIETATLCERRFPLYGDGYAIHGLALILSGKKKEGVALLDKAKELESELADSFRENYVK